MPIALNNNIAKIDDFYTGKGILENNFLPAFYIIEPTNRCNLRCTICPNKDYNEDEIGNMPWELFVKIIDEIKEVALVIQLYWMGEPFLHKHIFNMIEYCKNNTTAKIMLSTNGSFLNSENIERLINSALDEIIISVDACDSQDIYSQIRIGGNLDILNASIEKLIETNKHINIVLQFIDMFLNRTEKIKFIEKWSPMQCKTNIQCLYSWANQFPELNNMSDNLSKIANCTRQPCADLWYKASIHWNGKISICCFDWRSSEVIGDIFSDRIINIWHNKKIQSLRNSHKNRSFDEIKICSACDAWTPKEEYVKLYNLNLQNI